jgi:hypothetical protein
MEGFALYRFISFLHRFKVFVIFLTKSDITGSEMVIALSESGLNRFQILKMLEWYRRKLYHFGQSWLYLNLINILSPIIPVDSLEAIVSTRLTNE